MKKTFCFIVLFLTLSSGVFGSKMNAPQTIDGCNKKSNSFLFNIYKRFLSPIGGKRCTMKPSCSEYSVEAFKVRGLVTGFMKTCDRLLRCGNDQNSYRHIWLNGRRYSLDPVADKKINNINDEE